MKISVGYTRNLANVPSGDSLSSSPKRPMAIYSGNHMPGSEKYTDLLTVVDTASELMLIPGDLTHHLAPVRVEFKEVR